MLSKTAPFTQVWIPSLTLTLSLKMYLQFPSWDQSWYWYAPCLVPGSAVRDDPRGGVRYLRGEAEWRSDSRLVRGGCELSVGGVAGLRLPPPPGRHSLAVLLPESSLQQDSQESSAPLIRRRHHRPHHDGTLRPLRSHRQGDWLGADWLQWSGPDRWLLQGGAAPGPPVSHTQGRGFLWSGSRQCRRHVQHGLLHAECQHHDRQELLPEGHQATGQGEGGHLGSVGLHLHQLCDRNLTSHRVQIYLRSLVSFISN